METEEQPHHSGGIYNYFQGATINNLVINGNMNKNGEDHYENTENQHNTSKVTDEQISKAIIAINGDNKPLNEKQLFLGVICVLMSKYGWTGKFSTCCARINNLPQKELFEKACDYNCIKVITAYKFASIDYKDWETYIPNDSERVIFRKCKLVADAFDEAILMPES